MSTDKRGEEFEVNVTIEVQRPCLIEESLKKSCQEVKLMREGKIPKRNLADLYKKFDFNANEGK